MKATILDTKTGLTHIMDGPRSWQWAENNWSCDCNRNFPNSDLGNPEGICSGSHRFLVVDAQMTDAEDYEYTLGELNECYPPELLRAHKIDAARLICRPTPAVTK